MVVKNKNIFLAFHLYRVPECEKFWSSLKAGVALLKEKGYVVYYSMVCGDPYIAKARNTLANKFLKSKCDTFVFLADDLEYEPEDLLRLIETPGEVAVGAYRIKVNEPTYPVVVDSVSGIRADGCIAAKWVQTGFLRVDRQVFESIALHYPERVFYGVEDNVRVDVNYDFFPQGTGIVQHVWIGEDYGFCELWRGIGGEIWLIPDMNLTHYNGKVGYRGNYYIHLMCCPGGKLNRSG